MNWLTIILLGVLIVVCNATSDELRYHYERMFNLLIKLGSGLDYWMNPSLSWTNKYIPKNAILQFLFGTVLVWLTDFWHFLKAVVINSGLVIFLILIHEPFVWWKWLIELAVLNLLWGIIYELLIGIFGAIGTWIKKKEET